MTAKLLGESILESSQRASKIRSNRNERSGFGSSLVRMGLIRIVVVGLFLSLVGALVKTQIYEGSYYHDLADGNRARVVDLPAPRGIIADRNGNELVVNLPAFRYRQCDSSGQKCDVSTISKNQAIDLEVQGLKSGKSLAIDSVRSYPFGEATAHLLGYVSQISAEELKADNYLLPGDKIGRGGVEEQYDGQLRGKRGEELQEVDAMGNRLRTLSVKPPQPGQRINLAIDLGIQKVAYEQIKGRKAAVVATNPQNGEVLTLVSSPSFDPNVFTDINTNPADTTKQITQIFSDPRQPLFDRAIAGTYPAGSTFKIITATAGLESGQIDEKFMINDPGILVIGPYRFPNWKYLQDGGTQGEIDVVGAIQKSNDIFFYEVGGKVGVDGLAQWALKYGLARKSGLDLPEEAAGIFPTKSWRDAHARSWYLGDTYHLAIGQGDLLVTPLQDNLWTAAIANGGKLCQPHVLKQAADSGQQVGQCRDIGLHQKTLDLIKKGMIAACSPGGTAYPLFNFKDPKNPDKTIQIACKTGTAEFGDSAERTHAWLTAFAPADNPTIAVTTILEGAGEGADVASPVVKAVLEQWFQSEKN